SDAAEMALLPPALTTWPLVIVRPAKGLPPVMLTPEPARSRALIAVGKLIAVTSPAAPVSLTLAPGVVMLLEYDVTRPTTNGVVVGSPSASVTRSTPAGPYTVAYGRMPAAPVPTTP